MVLKLKYTSESLGGQNFQFSRSGVELRVCISVKPPVTAETAGLGTTLWEALAHRKGRAPWVPWCGCGDTAWEHGGNEQLCLSYLLFSLFFFTYCIS